MNKRKVWVEPKFAEAKQWHGMYRFRLRRIWRVNIEALLIASVQNIKQLLKGKHLQNRPKPPANAAALKLFPLIDASIVRFWPLNCNMPSVFVRCRHLFFNRLGRSVKPLSVRFRLFATN